MAGCFWPDPATRVIWARMAGIDPKQTVALLKGRESKMGYRKYCTISGVLFSLVALAHLSRIVYGTSIQVDDYVVPMFVSWIGLALPAALAVWAFRVSRETSGT